MGFSSSPPAPRARPVAGLPLDRLADAADELARAWAVTLIVARPPGAIAEIPLEDLARDGPRFCAQLLRALESDAELERLTAPGVDGGGEEPAPAASLRKLAGAPDLAAAVAAMEALRGVLWEALLGELRRPVLERADTNLLADLSDRLAYVCAMTLAAALPAAMTRRPQGRARDEVLVAETGGSSPPRGEPAVPPGAGGHGEVVIIDERERAASSRATVVARSRGADAEETGAPPPSPPGPRAGAGPAAARVRDTGPASPPPTRAPAQPPAHTVADSASPAGPAVEQEQEIEIRDERVEEGPAAWIRSIGRELERFALEGRPFAVLLVELMDLQPLRRSEPPEQLLRLGGEVQRTLESGLWRLSARGGASLTREAPGRFWMLAPGIDALRVRALAEQVADGVRRSVSHHGRPVEVVVGTAVCPGDGVQAAALAAHADVALYSARAEGSAGGRPAG